MQPCTPHCVLGPKSPAAPSFALLGSPWYDLSLPLSTSRRTRRTCHDTGLQVIFLKPKFKKPWAWGGCCWSWFKYQQENSRTNSHILVSALEWVQVNSKVVEKYCFQLYCCKFTCREKLQNMHVKIKLLKIVYGISSIHPLPWQQTAGEGEGGAGKSRISASFTD